MSHQRFVINNRLVFRPVVRWNIIRRFIIILYLLLAACGSTAPQPTQAPAYVLRVVHGSGSGRYAVGSVVHIWANPYSPGWIFSSWTGDIANLPDVRSMHSVLVMPSRDLMVEATYKEMLVWKVNYEVLDGRDVYYYFPPASKGVIVFFHGSGGDAREWTNLGAERRHFFDDAISEGYAIIAIDSADQINKQWELTLPAESNADFRAVRDILAIFKGRGEIKEALPIYGIGMSRGGQFATLAGYSLPMKALALMVADSVEEMITVSTVPMMWCLAEHDVIIDSEQALANYQQLTKRGVDAGFYVHPPMPIYPLYFVDTNGVDVAGSVQLFRDLKNHGFLDENNFLIQNPRFSGWEKYTMGFSDEIRLDIQDRLFVAYGEHAFYSDCDHRILDFFGAHP